MTEKPTQRKAWSGNEIRETFLRFFESKGHKRVRSSSLVPHGDPTLLFTNAGMNQFKDVFLGLEKRDYNKAVSAQKCVRAGGKHNDLENVGFTKRHHTFFEMLGNFSFGDYFKKEAIAYAWELVTSPEWFAIDKNKLYATVFGGAEIGGTGISGTGIPAGAGSADVGARHAVPVPGKSSASGSSTILGVDEEAKQFWLEQKVPAERIFAIPGLKENFWQMGDTGPCGPCSEIHYDMGPEASDLGHGTTAPECKFPCDCGRFVEIWNLVFMQYNRDESGKLTPLPKPCVDTGMGLERTAAVLQGVISNYDTDLFRSLIEDAIGLIHADPIGAAIEDSQEAASLRVIADHSRAATFLISDGVFPSNEGRGYVLRKIIRRAIRHGRLLGATRPFLSEMVRPVRDLMKAAYEELEQTTPQVIEVILAEETRFLRTIETGSRKLEEALVRAAVESYKQNREALQRAAVGGVLETIDEAIADLPRRNAAEVVRLISTVTRKDLNAEVSFPGDQAFQLYDTYGLPTDYLSDVVRDTGLILDQNGFDKAMEEQRARARRQSSFSADAHLITEQQAAYRKLAETFKTEPDFYHGTSTKDCRIEAIFLTGSANRADAFADEEKRRQAAALQKAAGRRYESVKELKAGESGEVVLDRTVIYAESGGQVADTGAFYDNSESQELAEVKGAFYPVAGLIAHKVAAKETLRVGDRVAVVADADRRARIIRNHTGTHLVHAALRNILGTHVKQSGSLNAPDRLRFDFSHFAHVDTEELRDIEQQVNEEIRLNTQIETNVTSLEDALASGALAFFGDKYPEHNVRVVTILDPRANRGFYSKELCGGTHVHHVGDIGVLKIVSEESVAAGVRRIEAVTGAGALEHYQRAAQLAASIAGNLNVAQDEVLAKLEKLSETVKQLEKELEAQRRKGALGQVDELAARVQVVKGIKVIAAEVQHVDREGLRQLVDSLRQKLGSGVVALGMPENGKVALIAGVTKDLTAKVHAGKLIQALAKQVGGSGGGRPDLAEAGGKDTAGLKTALQTVPSLIEALL